MFFKDKKVDVVEEIGHTDLILRRNGDIRKGELYTITFVYVQTRVFIIVVK